MTVEVVAVVVVGAFATTARAPDGASPCCSGCVAMAEVEDPLHTNPQCQHLYQHPYPPAPHWSCA